MMLNLKMYRIRWHTLHINCNSTLLLLCSTSYLSLRVSAAMSVMLSDDKTDDAFQIVGDRVDSDVHH
jgi:hypothetical protein